MENTVVKFNSNDYHKITHYSCILQCTLHGFQFVLLALIHFAKQDNNIKLSAAPLNSGVHMVFMRSYNRLIDMQHMLMLFRKKNQHLR